LAGAILVAFTPQYGIPDESSVRTAATLYARYRTRLDEDLRQRQRGEIIEVRARRVDLESAPSPRRTRESPGAEQTATGGATPEPGAGGSLYDRYARAENEPETLAPERAFIYEPYPRTGEINLRAGPQARGLLIDLLV